MIFAIRGATTVEKDEKQEMTQKVQTLLTVILERNNLEKKVIKAAFFTVTQDLQSIFAASAARAMGWTDIPLFDSLQPAVKGSMPKCIRVMLLCEDLAMEGDVQHVYLEGAKALRPDLSNS